MFALLPVAIAATPAKAQTIRDWIQLSDGDFDWNFNWSGLNTPDSTGESAQFNSGNTHNVTLTSGITREISDLLLPTGDITFDSNGPAPAILDMDDDALFTGGNLTLTKSPGMGDVTLNVGDRMQTNSGSTVSVLQGSDVTATFFDVGYSGGDGTMIVDGVGSTLTVDSVSRIGASGATGTLTFQNGSTGNSLNSTVRIMAGSSQANSTGRVNVLCGSTVQTGTIFVGGSSAAFDFQEATLTVDGPGSELTMDGASVLTIGDDVNFLVTSEVTVSNSAVMSTGTSDILIRNSGRLDVDASTFNANVNLTVNDGTLIFQNGATGTSLSGTDTVVTNGSTFSVHQGSDVRTHNLEIADAAGSGTLTVNGAGSRLVSSVLRAGLLSHGTLNVEAGGRFQAV